MAPPNFIKYYEQYLGDGYFSSLEGPDSDSECDGNSAVGFGDGVTVIGDVEDTGLDASSVRD